VLTGIVLAVASGVANGLFTTPMKLIPRWRWENIWLVFIVTACLAMPAAMVRATAGGAAAVLEASPPGAVAAAVLFGFMWGFGAIFFGLSVHRLGISLANSLVIGLSSALGSLVPLIVRGDLRLDASQIVLFAGVATFLSGVWMCGRAGRRREEAPAAGSLSRRALALAYLLVAAAGVMSAIFNIGYTLALPIAGAGERLGVVRFGATNVIWLLMLGAGSLPNIAYCGWLLKRHGSHRLFRGAEPAKCWGLSVLMGLLWGGSIFLYGAATPRLGAIGPSIGWPLSLAVALVVANLMGLLLGEWRAAPPDAVNWMRGGIAVLLVAILLCSLSSVLGGS
jgi:L-rhamnose-H+ transport protein